jgi:hypothetical protein
MTVHLPLDPEPSPAPAAAAATTPAFINPLLLLLLLLLGPGVKALGLTTILSRSEAKDLDPDADLAEFGSRVAAATSAWAIRNVSCGNFLPGRFCLDSLAGVVLLLLPSPPAAVLAGLLLLLLLLLGAAAADGAESCCPAAAWKQACLSVMYSVPSKVICRATDIAQTCGRLQQSRHGAGPTTQHV